MAERAKTTKKNQRKKQNKVREFLNKLWENRFIIALLLLQALSSITTLGGMYAISGSIAVAIIGMLAVQILFASCWHELMNPEESDGKSKSYAALATLGVACLLVSGFFSSLGFYQTTKLEGAKTVDARNYNIAELGNAKNAFTLVIQQGQKNAGGEIELKKKAIQTKNDEIKNSASKIAVKELRNEIKRLETEIKGSETLKTELAEANYPESVNTVKIDNSNEVANAIETIKVETQKIAAKGKVELTPDLLSELSYQPLTETDAEGTFFQKLLSGEPSILVVCVIGFGIDFASILALFANRRKRQIEDAIYENRAWFFRILKALFSLKTVKPPANTTAETVETASMALPQMQEIKFDVKDFRTLKIHELSLDVEDLSEIPDKLGKVQMALLAEGVKADSIGLPSDWQKLAEKGEPIVIEIGKTVDNRYSNNGHLLGVAK